MKSRTLSYFSIIILVFIILCIIIYLHFGKRVTTFCGGLGGAATTGGHQPSLIGPQSWDLCPLSLSYFLDFDALFFFQFIFFPLILNLGIKI